MKVLVLGASGRTGLAVTRAVGARGIHVRAFVRNPDTEPAVRDAGAAEVVVGDLRDLETVTAAARGMDGLFLIGPRFMPEEGALGRAVVDIAAHVGARRLVLSGVYHPSIQPLLNHRSKVLIEDQLYTSDLEFVVLQPARFMHGLLLSGWERIVTEGVLPDSFAPDVRMAYVDYDDVAEVAAIGFAEDRLVRGTYELSGDGELTLHEVAAAVSDALGREVRAVQTPFDELSRERRGLHNPYAQETFRRLWTYYNEHGFRGGNPIVLRTILGRAPNSIGDVVRRELQRRGASRP